MTAAATGVVGVPIEPIHRNIKIFCDEYLDRGRSCIQMPSFQRNDDEDNIKKPPAYRSLGRITHREFCPITVRQGKYSGLGTTYRWKAAGTGAPKRIIWNAEKHFESFA
jgi:hypothetical protein